jgi:phosphoribosylaminoimidazole (AIR) synthetase
MFRTFNMGIGMVLVAPPEAADRLGVEGARVIGRVVDSLGVDIR